MHVCVGFSLSSKTFCSSSLSTSFLHYSECVLVCSLYVVVLCFLSLSIPRNAIKAGHFNYYFAVIHIPFPFSAENMHILGIFLLLKLSSSDTLDQNRRNLWGGESFEEQGYARGLSSQFLMRNDTRNMF